MNQNNFFTLMIIPEKSAAIKRFIIPNWVLRWGLAIVFFISVLTVMMTMDYWYISNQLSQNKKLQIENRQLKEQLQMYKIQIATIEDNIKRVETFSNRLKVIANIKNQ